MGDSYASVPAAGSFHVVELGPCDYAPNDDNKVNNSIRLTCALATFLVVGAKAICDGGHLLLVSGHDRAEMNENGTNRVGTSGELGNRPIEIQAVLQRSPVEDYLFSHDLT